MTDAAGLQVQLYEYEPYGMTVRDETDSSQLEAKTSYKFTGQEEDASTGLYYYHARYYDPELGRFVQADNYVQNVLDPQIFNRYTYCRNNSVCFVDPSGNFIESIIYAIVFTAVSMGLEAAEGSINAALNGESVGRGARQGAMSGAQVEISYMFGEGGMNPNVPTDFARLCNRGSARVNDTMGYNARNIPSRGYGISVSVYVGLQGGKGFIQIPAKDKVDSILQQCMGKTVKGIINNNRYGDNPRVFYSKWSITNSPAVLTHIAGTESGLLDLDIPSSFSFKKVVAPDINFKLVSGELRGGLSKGGLESCAKASVVRLQAGLTWKYKDVDIVRIYGSVSYLSFGAEYKNGPFGRSYEQGFGVMGLGAGYEIGGTNE